MLRYLIRTAGFTPQQRDILYNHVNRDASTAGGRERFRDPARVERRFCGLSEKGETRKLTPANCRPTKIVDWDDNFRVAGSRAIAFHFSL